jgi:hypothetical protein
MTRLDDQLAKAKERTQEERDARRSAKHSNGGPVEGGPDDRWIRYHATISSREWLRLAAAVMGPIGILLGAVLAAVGAWQAAGLGVLIAGLPVVSLAAHHLRLRARAITDHRAFVAALPFEMPSYLESMRQPRFWSASGYNVVYRARIQVICGRPIDRAVLDGLVPLGDCVVRSFDDTKATIEPASAKLDDPWWWARTLIREVLVPLTERSPIERVQLAVTPEVTSIKGRQR